MVKPYIRLSKAVGEKRIIWLVRFWLINVFCTLCRPCFSCPTKTDCKLHGYPGMLAMNCLRPLRIPGIGTFAMFWCLESYYIIITGILWCDLHLNTPVTDHMASIVLSNCVLPLPLLNMECAACMHQLYHWHPAPSWFCINVNVNPWHLHTELVNMICALFCVTFTTVSWHRFWAQQGT